MLQFESWAPMDMCGLLYGELLATCSLAAGYVSLGRHHHGAPQQGPINYAQGGGAVCLQLPMAIAMGEGKAHTKHLAQVPWWRASDFTSFQFI